MKDLDPKSLIIGILATALLFACADTDKTLPSLVSEAKAATGVNDKWDDKQQWEVSYSREKFIVSPVNPSGAWVIEEGWEPYTAKATALVFRRRIK